MHSLNAVEKANEHLRFWIGDFGVCLRLKYLKKTKKVELKLFYILHLLAGDKRSNLNSERNYQSCRDEELHLMLIL